MGGGNMFGRRAETRAGRWAATFAAGLLFAAALAVPAAPAADLDRRLVLVTLDGLNWTEVFRGADPERAADPAFVAERDRIKADFVAPADRARALMPFLHDVVAKEGVLIGDRDHGSCAAVANDQWFSYPGYNEILTGRPDPAITSNEHGPNRNVTVLEWLNRQPGVAGRVRAVASWANFTDIINASRSGVPVNAGWEGGAGDGPDAALIAGLEAGAPRLWPTVRLDTFTHAQALDALRRHRPRVLYVSYGETDDFAHEGRYDQTLWAARRADAFIAEIWRTLQADPDYAGRTTLIVTTDHGRGEGDREAWKHHGKPNHKGSDAVWIAAMGPDVRPPESSKACASLSQVAATAVKALGLDWRAFHTEAGAPLDIFGTGRP
jgi:hypothetical protein